MDDVTSGTTARISLTLNGRPRAIAVEATVSDLLADLELQDRLVVVEWNGTIVDRTRFSSTVLVDGDILEIVHFVGGG